MAAALAAADLDQALLAALRAAVPEQVGDDLVLRLADGRVFFIDGFFAANEAGDGMPPEPGAIELAREIADLLLSASEIDTAAGGETPAPPPSSGVGFEAFESATQPAEEETADAETDEEEIEDVRAPLRELDRTQYSSEPGSTSFASEAAGVSLNLRAIGTIAIVAGSAGAPTWGGYLDSRQLFYLEDLLDQTAEGWFPGLSKALPFSDPLDPEAFADKRDPDGVTSTYAPYLVMRTEWVEFADGRTIWANLTPAEGPFGDRDNSRADHLPQGMLPADIFAGNDFILGTNEGVDRLYGFGGDDILIGYLGANFLFGGNGDDILVTNQVTSTATIDGGAGDDTLIYVVDNEIWPLRLSDLGIVSGIERLILLPQDPTNPAFLNEDFGVGRIVSADLVLDLDAASILAWGGHLIIDGTAAGVRLADVENWERLPADPAEPAYVHYRTVYAGETVTLAVLAGASQPIADVVHGTADNDVFFTGHRIFGLFDGGAGDDRISGGLRGGPLGLLDYSDPASTPYRNIENIVLEDAADTLILSAPAIAAMTDSRNTLWITSPYFGGQNGQMNGLYLDGGGKGQVHLDDPTLWTALGYLSVETDQSNWLVESGVGAVYGATIGNEAVYLFVQVGITQPIVGNTAGADRWFVSHGGWVAIPAADVAIDISLIDLRNNLTNIINFDVATAANLAGPDQRLVVTGDGSGDTVAFVDMANWRKTGVDGAYTIYQGSDPDGHQVELRIATALTQPYLLPDPDAGDLDFVDLTNGRAETLTFDVATARHYAGADATLAIYGDPWLDQLAFHDPENWKLSGRDGNFFIYEGDDGATQATLLLHDNVGRPLFLPTFTDGDDDMTLADLLVVTQYSYIDGKGGFDTLHLMDAGEIAPPLDFLKHVEAIDLTNSVASSFVVSASTLAANDISGPLYITGESQDAVILDLDSVIDGFHDWEMLGTVTNAAVSDNPFTLYQVTIHYQSGDVTAQLAVDQALIQPALPA